MRQNENTWFYIGGSGLDRTDEFQKFCGSGLVWIQFYRIRTGLGLKNFTVRSSLLGTLTSLPAAAYCHSLAANTTLGLYRDLIPRYFWRWFSLRLGRTQKKTNRVHAEDTLKKMLVVPNRLQNVNGWSCSSQLWHPRRFGYDCLSNSCRVRLWKGVMTAHNLVGVQHQRWSVVI